jgi:O-Antigen ligase
LYKISSYSIYTNIYNIDFIRTLVRLDIMNSHRIHNDKFLLILLLALFVWLPLPFGSNRPWAVMIMEIWVFTLSSLWLLLYTFNKVTFNQLFFRLKIPLTCFILFIIYVFFQTISLPASIINVISPNVAGIYTDSFSVLNTSGESVSLSLNRYTTYGKFIESLCYFLLFTLIILLINTHNRLKLFIYVLFTSGVAQAVYGTLMTLSELEYGFIIKKEVGIGLATGTFTNRNHFSGYLEMCLALGIGMLISTLHSSPAVNRHELWQRITAIFLGNKIRLRIGLAIMVIALVSSHSRMGNAAFFTSLSIIGIAYLLLVKKPPRSAIILFISLMIIDIFIVGTWFGLDKLIDRFEETQIFIEDNNKGQQTSSLTNVVDQKPIGAPQNVRALQLYLTKIQSNSETRDEVYRDTFTMIKNNPFFGTGGGTYINSFLHYRNYDIYQIYDHTHNDYLEFWAEYGFIGIILLAIIVLYSFINALIAIRQRHSSFMQGVAFSSAMGILSILIHSISDFNLQIPANASLFVALLAIGNISRLKTHHNLT